MTSSLRRKIEYSNGMQGGRLYMATPAWRGPSQAVVACAAIASYRNRSQLVRNNPQGPAEIGATRKVIR
jgi:hypothetical protein